jgi:hypothetical protein|tara:strand:- start:239 stop:343 length:105 start_codon:yes stop_codon:yes gene_type:complete
MKFSQKEAIGGIGILTTAGGTLALNKLWHKKKRN